MPFSPTLSLRWFIWVAWGVGVTVLKVDAKTSPISSAVSPPEKPLIATPASLEMDLPTDNQLLFSAQDEERFFQPTFSGRILSAQFGCVRDPKGTGRFTRFHEGVDIRSEKQDWRGEPADEVRSSGDGTVAYVCRTASNSNYGRYVVIEHERQNVSFYTLYAHLSKVRDEIKEGRRVARGDPLGILGRSSNEYHINQKYAHLHFEVDLMINDHYVEWSQTHGGGTPLHGKYNGANMMGVDPVGFFQFLQINPGLGIRDFVLREKVAFRVVVPLKRDMSWIRHYPFSLEKPIAADSQAMEISMTALGMPVSILPLKASEMKNGIQEALNHGVYPLTYANGKELRSCPCVQLLTQKGRYWGLGSKGYAWLRQLLY